MQAHRHEFRLAAMCRVFEVHRSGYYAWLRQPRSARALDNDRLVTLIRQFWQDSGGVYGSPRIHADLREAGETCSLNRIARLMQQEKIHALIGYKRRKHFSGAPALQYPNLVQQDFTVLRPNQVWSTDITYIRTYEGWLYVASVMDLYSRRIVGWSMKSSLHRDIVLEALIMALWRRHPAPGLLIHSDQGSQFGSDDWNRLCAEHGIKISMSGRGNCYDNAVKESFFASLKKERIRNRIYSTREEAKRDIFDYTELFYNPKRRHTTNQMLSPIDFETRLSNI